MFYARPFTRERQQHLPMKAAGADVVELLVPEPGELDLAETRRAADDAGLAIVLAARVNLTRDLASGSPGSPGGHRLSGELRRHRVRPWSPHRRRPALRYLSSSRAAPLGRPR